MNKSQSMRYVPDMIEPFVVKELQRKYHSFFIFRASDYDSFERLIKIHKFDCSNIDFKHLLIENWSAIDIIYFKIKESPIYKPIQEYFRFMDDLRTKLSL